MSSEAGLTDLHATVSMVRPASALRMEAFMQDATTRIWLGMRLDKVQRGLLGGGDKSSQPSDIDSAIALSKTLLKEPEDDPQN